MNVSKRMMWSAAPIVCLLATATLLGEGLNPPALQPKPLLPPTGPSRTLLVCAMPPMPLEHHTVEDWARKFPSFEHQPFTAGVNPLVLPFHFIAKTEKTDPRMAVAFAFLVSEDLGWLRDSYNSRSVYFTFRHSAQDTQALQKQYSAAVIARQIAFWGATQAVGGEIVATDSGYSGTLNIFAPSGEVVFKKTYDTPHSFFHLLGDMDVDSLAFLGMNPSLALSEFLHQPRCKKHKTLVSLGAIPSTDEGSEPEEKLCDQILQNEPDFAEVRRWTATLRFWRTGDAIEFERQKALSLKSRINPHTAGDLNRSQCPDIELASHYEEWLDRIGELSDPDAPSVLAARLEMVKDKVLAPEDLVRRGAQALARLPNSFPLNSVLSRIMEERQLYETAASLRVCSVQDRWIRPSETVRAEEWRSLAVDAYDSGFPAWALDALDHREQLIEQCANDYGEDGVGPCRAETLQLRLARANYLHAMGRFAEALELCSAVLKTDHDVARQDEALVVGCACAARSANFESLAALTQTYASALARLKADGVFKAYLAFHEGQPVNLNSIAKGERGTLVPLEFAKMAAELDYANKYTLLRRESMDAVLARPFDRAEWLFLDAFAQLRYSPKFDGFYQALEWLHSDDPWVRQAVAASARVDPANRFKPVDPKALHDRVLKFPLKTGRALTQAEAFEMGQFPETPYWQVADAVRQFIEKRDYPAALETIQHFQAGAAGWNVTEVIRFGNTLITRVILAQKSAAEKGSH